MKQKQRPERTSKTDPCNILILRRTALATAIAGAITAPMAQARDWDRNIELFLSPTTKRTLAGGQLLQPLLQDADSLTYLDFRGIFNVGNTNEFNLGLGYRRLVGDRRWIVGGYVAGDTRESIHNKRYNQISFGLETLSTDWDFRANYYLPITDTKVINPVLSGARFQGHSLFVNSLVEEALDGADIEVGHILPFIPIGETRLFVGGYYFDGDVAPSTGLSPRIRLEFRPRKNIILGTSVQHDDLFGTEARFTIKFSLGYKSETGVRTLSERMIQFVERDIDIKDTGPLDDERMTSSDPAFRSTLSTDVYHIDNTASAGGDGTFEHPYDSIAACESGGPGTCGDNAADSIIYVHAGDGTSTGLNSTLTLSANQKLIGQGFNFYGYGGDAFPLFENGGKAVVLADNNEVAGLKFVGGGIGVYGSNVTGFNIHGNRFNIHTGIDIETITASSHATVGMISDNLFTNNQYGVVLYNHADGAGNSATQTVTLADNTFTGDDRAIYAYNLSLHNGSATQSLTLKNNSLSGGRIGLDIENVAVYGGKATQTSTLEGNSISGMTQKYGSAFVNYGVNQGTTTQTVNISGGNQFNNNNYSAVLLLNGSINHAHGIQNVNFSGNNQFNKNGGQGVVAVNDSKYASNGIQNIDLSQGNNQFNGNGKNAALPGKYAYLLGGSLSFINLAAGSNATQNVDLTGGAHQFNNNAYSGISAFNLAADQVKYAPGSHDAAATQTLNLNGGAHQANNNRNGLLATNSTYYVSGLYTLKATQTVDLSGGNAFTNNSDHGVAVQNNNADIAGVYDIHATQTLNLTGTILTGNDCLAINNFGDQTVTPGGACP